MELNTIQFNAELVQELAQAIWLLYISHGKYGQELLSSKITWVSFPACPLNIKSLTLIVYFLNLCAVYVPDSIKKEKLPSFKHSNFKEVETSYNWS
jgi:hypothetical protein